MAEYGGGAISLSQTKDMSHTNSEDDDDQRLVGDSSCSGGRISKLKLMTPKSSGSPASEMGELTIRKPRGRPPGSKNRPKPPIVITRDSEAALKPVVLEICPGNDVVDQVLDYARRRQVGLSILSGCGTVSSVTLRHPMAHAPTISLHGPLHIVCLSGTYLGPMSAVPHSSSSSFSVSLAGSQGQVFGGIIAGKLTAQTPVVVVAATFAAPSFHRLPGANVEEDEEAGKKNNISQAGVGNEVAGGAVPMAPGMYNVVGGGGGGQVAADLMHWGSETGGGRPHGF